MTRSHSSRVLSLEDTIVRYYGQYVAVAVAQTVEQAGAAAEAVKVTYTTSAHNTADRLVGLE